MTSSSTHLFYRDLGITSGDAVDILFSSFPILLENYSGLSFVLKDFVGILAQLPSCCIVWRFEQTRMQTARPTIRIRSKCLR